MLFNSIDFALFLPVVFLLYWLVVNRNLRQQNILLLVASYFFYGWWDFRFLFLLLFSTFLDYFTGIRIYEAKTSKAKKFWLWLSIVINLGFLCVFKYFNFFIGAFSNAFTLFGYDIGTSWTLRILLPVGISFYTFHGLSYVLDLYRGRMEPTRNFVDYSVFVSFFPLLVAGPIERATHLLPQIQRERKFSYVQAADGLRQILWGLFKKVVIADNCAHYANMIFSNPESYSSPMLVMGAIFFTFQIYADFSGYSDMALGTARLFGIELLRNFAYPYFSRDIAEFWRRWHISLSSWFRDYLYIPMGGSKGGTWMKVRNTFIIFLVSGFWHGANWTFLAWGALNAIYFLPLLLLKLNRNNLETVAQDRTLPTVKEFLQMLLTFGLTVFAWIFFRAESVGQAFSYVDHMFTGPLTGGIYFMPRALILGLAVFILIEWRGRLQPYAIADMGMKWPKVWRWSFYYSLLITTIFFAGKQQQFIYFQF
jgi:D-alanyl-lipoteichoic acid acyltransferase DltB (MBOAT superfamily)